MKKCFSNRVGDLWNKLKKKKETVNDESIRKFKGLFVRNMKLGDETSCV